MAISLSLAIIFLALGGKACAQDEADMFKKLAGPPSEFRNFSEKINASSLESHSNELRLPLSILSVGIDWKYQFPVDPVASIIVNVAYMKKSMGDNELVVTLLGPSGAPVQPDMRKVSQSLFGYYSELTVVSLTFAKPPPGTWTAVLGIKGRASGKPLKALAWIGFNTTAMVMMSYSPTLDSMLYRETVVESFVTDVSGGFRQDLSSYPRLGAAVKNCTMTVTLPDGKTVGKTMQPSKGDMVGSFVPMIKGMYSVDVLMTGEEQGYPFARSCHLDISVAPQSLNITTSQSHHLKLYHHPVTLSEIILIRVAVLWDNTAKPVYRSYAEVYGTDSSKQSVAVAYVGGMVEVKKSSDGYYVEWQLDSKWLVAAQASFPIILKNIVFEDTSGYVTILHVQEELSLHTEDPQILTWKPPGYKPEEIEITYEMRNGFNPYRHKYLNTSYQGVVLLVHGYCASQDPFTVNEFSNMRVYRRFNSNMPVHDFAMDVLRFIRNSGIGPFSIVAHSQGGMVGAHLLQYITTPMDAMFATGGRLVQSVGTPYSGTPAAGNLASIGAIFGIGCGTNSDLTPRGAGQWQRGIDRALRSHVFYYTTQYRDTIVDQITLQNFCIPGDFLALDRPNDGTTPLSGSHMSGAIHVSHSTAGECHIDKMRWPSQGRNSARNAEMNSLAAR